jgi:hypothetical protein
MPKRKRTDDEAPRKRTKNLTAKIDMRDVTPGGGSVRVPEQDYKVRITDVKKEVNKNSGNTQVILSLTILEPEKYAGKVIRDYLTLTKKAAYRIGMVFDAVGVKYKQSIMEFNFGKLLEKELGATVYDDEYNKRVKSKVADYLDLETIEGILSGEDLDEEEDEDLEEEDEDEDEDDDDDDEDEDLDEDL